MPEQGTDADSLYDSSDDDFHSIRESIEGMSLGSVEDIPLPPPEHAGVQANEEDFYPHPSRPPPPRPSSSDTTPAASIKTKTSSGSSKRKKLPMVIPQLSSEKGLFGSPFARAYPKELENYSLSRDDFLTFLDGFNDIFVASATVQSISYAHRVLQLAFGHRVIDLDTPEKKKTSSLKETGASAEKSYGKILLYLQAVNKDIFHPAGVHVSILKTEDMIKKVNYPADKLKLLPIDSAQTSVHDHMLMAQRMKPLDGYVSELDFGTTQTDKSDNFFRRFAESQQARVEKEEARRQTLQNRRADRAQRRADRKDTRLNRKVQNLEDELETYKERMEKKLAADPNDKAIAAEFERTKSRILRRMDYLTKRRPGESTQPKAENRPEKKTLKTVSAKAEREANKVQWLVLTEFGTRFAMFADDDSESSFDIDEADYLQAE